MTASEINAAIRSIQAIDPQRAAQIERISTTAAVLGFLKGRAQEDVMNDRWSAAWAAGAHLEPRELTEAAREALALQPDRASPQAALLKDWLFPLI